MGVVQVSLRAAFDLHPDILRSLDRDAGEVHDLYLEEKDKLAELVDFWVTYVAETGTIVLAEQPEYAASAKGFGFLK